MSYRGSKCKLCEHEFGVGTHFGTAFLCTGCEEWLWDFLRAAKQMIKKKK